MKGWNLIFRRTHLYLGMLLIPWLLIYALSTLFLNHTYFRQFRPADPQFVPLWEKDYTLDAPLDAHNLRATAQRILADQGISGGFSVQRQGQRLNINVQNFLEPKRLVYEPGEKRLRAEKKKFAWTELTVRLHFRAGYGQTGWMQKLWGLVIDVFCVTLLIWIGTGLYLW